MAHGGTVGLVRRPVIPSRIVAGISPHMCVALPRCAAGREKHAHFPTLFLEGVLRITRDSRLASATHSFEQSRPQ